MNSQEKTQEELKQFCEAQQKVIIQLNKKIQKLENEKVHLEQLLKAAPVPLIGKEIDLSGDLATEEAICIIQIKRLEEISLGRELTLEETRKLEAFSKILATFRAAPKKPESGTKNLSNEELLRLVKNDDN